VTKWTGVAGSLRERAEKVGGVGAIVGARLAAGPGGVFPVDEAARPAQRGGRHGMTRAQPSSKALASSRPYPPFSMSQHARASSSNLASLA
jgi:hypothetical protein